MAPRNTFPVRFETPPPAVPAQERKENVNQQRQLETPTRSYILGITWFCEVTGSPRVTQAEIERYLGVSARTFNYIIATNEPRHHHARKEDGDLDPDPRGAERVITKDQTLYLADWMY